MKIIDLIEEKLLLQKRCNNPFSEENVIGREGCIEPTKAKESFKKYQDVMKRYDEISDRLNQIMAKTFIKVDDRRISLATALNCIRKGGQPLFPEFGMGMGVAPMQLSLGTQEDADLYSVINSRISTQLNISLNSWNAEFDGDERSESKKVIDPNDILSNKEFYENFYSDYIVKLTIAFQKAAVTTDVD